MSMTSHEPELKLKLVQVAQYAQGWRLALELVLASQLRP
jgi:hypothetical protein